MMIPIFAKDNNAGTAHPEIVESTVKWSLQVDGDLAGDTINVNLVGADPNDPLTGVHGTANQPLLDESGIPVVISASTSNPLGFYSPARIQIKKPATANPIGILLLLAKD